jgi:hypothetical protein
MKASLSFDISDEHEFLEFQKVIHANKMASIIHHLKVNIIPRLRKDEVSLEYALEVINDEFNDLPVNIEDLID